RGDVGVGRAIDACEGGRGDDAALADAVDAAHTGHDGDSDHMARGCTVRAPEAELVTDVPSQTVGAEPSEPDLVGGAGEPSGEQPRREIAFDPFDAHEAEARGRADDASRSFGEDHHPGDVGIWRDGRAQLGRAVVGTVVAEGEGVILSKARPVVYEAIDARGERG